MRVLITGGAGFVGVRLAQTLLERGTLSDRPIEHVVLADIAPPPSALLADARVDFRQGPLLPMVDALCDESFDGVFHLDRELVGLEFLSIHGITILTRASGETADRVRFVLVNVEYRI